MCLIFDTFLQMFIKTKIKKIFPLEYFLFLRRCNENFLLVTFFSNVATIKQLLDQQNL